MDLAHRLKQLISEQGMSSSDFAQTIHVQASAISHILSGRNKPSLDFILKLKNHYPSLNLNWFITGMGEKELPTSNHKTIKDYSHPTLPSTTNKEFSSKKLTKIILFYSDGTFEYFIQ